MASEREIAFAKYWEGKEGRKLTLDMVRDAYLAGWSDKPTATATAPAVVDGCGYEGPCGGKDAHTSAPAVVGGIEAEVAKAEIEWSIREDFHRYPRDFWHARLSVGGFDTGWRIYGEQEQAKLSPEEKAEAEAELRSEYRAHLEWAASLASPAAPAVVDGWVLVGWQTRRSQEFLDRYPNASEFVLTIHETEREARMAGVSTKDMANGAFPPALLAAVTIRPVYAMLAASSPTTALREEEREQCAKVAEQFGPSRPLLRKDPPFRILGRWEGEQAASEAIAAAIRARKDEP